MDPTTVFTHASTWIWTMRLFYTTQNWLLCNLISSNFGNAVCIYSKFPPQSQKTVRWLLCTVMCSLHWPLEWSNHTTDSMIVLAGSIDSPMKHTMWDCDHVAKRLLTSWISTIGAAEGFSPLKKMEQKKV